MIPNRTHGVTRALDALERELRAALDDPTPYPGNLTDIVGALAHAVPRLSWCRDAALHLARDAAHCSTWAELQTATATSDSTLDDRLRRFRDREART